MEAARGGIAGPAPRIGLVVLAAGASTRMGVAKQLLAVHGRSLLRHAAEEALLSGCRPVIVVLGAHAARLQEEIAQLPVRVAVNARWSAGMSTSIRAGIEALLTGPGADEVSAAILAVCDQPFFSARVVCDLVAAHERFGCDIVAAAYAGTRGVPALFRRSLFPELVALDGHEGARRVIQAHPDRTLAVPFVAGAVDLDTPEDYARLFAMPGDTFSEGASGDEHRS